MHHLGYLGYLGLKEAQRVGVGHHHAGDAVVEKGAQVLHIDHTIGGAANLHHFQSAHGGRGGVGAVGTVGHYHFRAFRITAFGVVAAYYHQTGQLAMGTGKGIQGELLQTRKGGQTLLQVVVHGQRTLTGAVGLQGVQVAETGHVGGLLVDHGVVLHRAAAQRIESVVHTEVVAAVVGVVAYHGHLVTLGQGSIVLAPHFFGHGIVAVFVGGQAEAFTAGFRQFENQVSV